MTPEQLNEVRELATRLHEGQTRNDGETPYITHPIQVAEEMLMDEFDPTIVAAAYLHDTIEDCEDINPSVLFSLLNNIENIEPTEATAIVSMVVQMTSPDKMFGVSHWFNRKTRKAMMRAHFAVVSPAAASIKIYDRYSNITDMRGFDAKFTKQYITETRDLIDVLYQIALPTQSLLKLTHLEKECAVLMEKVS